MFKLICATKCSNNHMHPQIHSQDNLNFTLTLAILTGAALPHLSDRWAKGVFIPILFLPNGYLLPSAHSSSSKNRKGALSLSLSPSISE